jgi:hypothetical protein
MAGTTTTPRTRRPRKATAARAGTAVEEFDVDAELAQLGFAGEDGPIAADGSIRPIEIGKRGRTPNPMVDLFTLDGGETYYQVPAKPPAMLAFAYQEDLRKTLRIKDPKKRKAAQELATQQLFVDLLGQDALDALRTSREVDEKNIEDIFAALAHLCFGKTGVVTKVEEAQGN